MEEDRTLIRHPEQYAVMPVGGVMTRRPGVTRWAAHSWRATDVLPGAGAAAWRELRRDGDVVSFHAATVPLELHGAETEAYRHGLAARVPCLYVVLRDTGFAAKPLDVALVTASPYEAQDYSESGEEVVEKVAMPVSVIAWVEGFCEAFHAEVPFVKRRRDRKDVDGVEDGIGDARIAQAADVYRSPASKRARIA